MMEVPADLHVHTFLSRCCEDPRQTPEAIAGLAGRRGLRRIALTDHVWFNPAVEPCEFYRVQPPEKLLDLARRIHAGPPAPVEILAGCEADMASPDRIGMTKEFKEHFDLVLLASDHFHIRSFVEQPESDAPQAVAKHMMKFFRAAALSGLCDVLVHPMMPLGFERQYDRIAESISDAELEDAFGIAAERKLGIEINAGILRQNRERNYYDPDSLLRVFAVAKRMHCLFTFGSDAHALEDFDALALVSEFADRLGLTAQDLHPLMSSGK